MANIKYGKTISERLWTKRLLQLADMYMIVYPCKRCGSPCNQGYVCQFCPENDPR